MTLKKLLKNKLLVVKVGSDERPAGKKDIKDINYPPAKDGWVCSEPRPCGLERIEHLGWLAAPHACCL